jgi:excisionase family DNA binding protein
MTKEKEKVDKSKDFLTAAEVGIWLGINKRLVLDLMKDGELKGYHFRKAYKFKPSDVEDYIKRSEYIPGQKVEDDEE